MEKERRQKDEEKIVHELPDDVEEGHRGDRALGHEKGEHEAVHREQRAENVGTLREDDEPGEDEREADDEKRELARHVPRRAAARTAPST